MRIAILSDIHANLSALEAVFKEVEKYNVDGLILIGDLINYGMRPNEVIEKIKSIKKPIYCNIWGNHEKALMDGDLVKFSTDRGRAILNYTKEIISKESLDYINMEMVSEGKANTELSGKKILNVHGDLDDPYWGKLEIDLMTNEKYSAYDYVISGHTHKNHYVEHFIKVDNPVTRNQKRTIFINPGSVGQPRNLNNNAQFGILDLESSQYTHCSVSYDIAFEQSLYTNAVDSFYRDRLATGI